MIDLIRKVVNDTIRNNGLNFTGVPPLVSEPQRRNERLPSPRQPPTRQELEAQKRKNFERAAQGVGVHEAAVEYGAEKAMPGISRAKNTAARVGRAAIKSPGVVMDAALIATAKDDDQRNRAMAGIAGGRIGGWAGGALGSGLGPAGTFVGAVGGSALGSEAGTFIYDHRDDIARGYDTVTQGVGDVVARGRDSAARRFGEAATSGWGSAPTDAQIRHLLLGY